MKLRRLGGILADRGLARRIGRPALALEAVPSEVLNAIYADDGDNRRQNGENVGIISEKSNAGKDGDGVLHIG